MESGTQGSRPRSQKKIQGQGQPFRGLTLSRPRTGLLKDQRHRRKLVFSKIRKKKVLKKIFQAIFEKRGLQKFFQAIYKILTIQKIVLSSRRGQGNFREREASKPRT